MNLRALFKRDMCEVLGEVGTPCTVSYKGRTARIVAVLNDANVTNGNYTYVEGEAVNCTAQFNVDELPFEVGVGARLVSEGIAYRVSGITRTAGDSSITLSLVVEGKR